MQGCIIHVPFWSFRMILTNESSLSAKKTLGVSFPLKWREPSGDDNYKEEKSKGKQKRPSKQSEYFDFFLPRIGIWFVLHVFINMGYSPHLCKKGQILVWIILKCRQGMHHHISGGNQSTQESLSILFFYSPCLHWGRKPLFFGGHKYFLPFQFSNWTYFSTTQTAVLEDRVDSSEIWDFQSKTIT